MTKISPSKKRKFDQPSMGNQWGSQIGMAAEGAASYELAKNAPQTYASLRIAMMVLFVVVLIIFAVLILSAKKNGSSGDDDDGTASHEDASE